MQWVGWAALARRPRRSRTWTRSSWPPTTHSRPLGMRRRCTAGLRGQWGRGFFYLPPWRPRLDRPTDRPNHARTLLTPGEQRQLVAVRKVHADRALEARGGAGRRDSDEPVRPRPGRLSGLSVFRCESGFCSAFVWLRSGLNSQKRRFPDRAGSRKRARARSSSRSAASTYSISSATTGMSNATRTRARTSRPTPPTMRTCWGRRRTSTC
jgi:hypothetical protein